MATIINWGKLDLLNLILKMEYSAEFIGPQFGKDGQHRTLKMLIIYAYTLRLEDLCM